MKAVANVAGSQRSTNMSTLDSPSHKPSALLRSHSRPFSLYTSVFNNLGIFCLLLFKISFDSAQLQNLRTVKDIPVLDHHLV